MRIYDDVFEWEGFGGRLRLGSGKCRLRIFDLKKSNRHGTAHLKRYIVIASDISESRMSVRSCVSHIATRVAQDFNIDPQRMLFVEYYPETHYGPDDEKCIPERFDAVDFTWHGDKAMHAKWRALKPPILDLVKAQMQTDGSSSNDATTDSGPSRDE
jgi:hypothetical protein